MGADTRIWAGVDLDGSMVASGTGTKPAAVAGALGRRPFLLMTSDGHGPDGDDPTVREFWSGLTGWRRRLGLTGSGHQRFTDRQTILAQIASAGLTDGTGLAAITAAIGTIDPARSVAAQRAYLTAFFDLHLRGQDSGLFRGTVATHPDVRLLAG